MKLRKNTNYLTLYLKKHDSPWSTSEIGKNVYIFVFISSFVSFGVCIHVPYFFDVVRNQASNKNYLLRLIKWRPKVHEKATSRKHALNNDQWKLLRKTISHWEFGYGLFPKLPRTIIVRAFWPSSLKHKRGILTS